MLNIVKEPDFTTVHGKTVNLSYQDAVAIYMEMNDYYNRVAVQAEINRSFPELTDKVYPSDLSYMADTFDTLKDNKAQEILVDLVDEKMSDDISCRSDDKECCANCKWLGTECYNTICTHPDAPPCDYIPMPDDSRCPNFEKEKDNG